MKKVSTGCGVLNTLRTDRCRQMIPPLICVFITVQGYPDGHYGSFVLLSLYLDAASRHFPEPFHGIAYAYAVSFFSGFL